MFTEDDPAQWNILRAAQQARHGAAIAYVRRQVGPGTEYANEVARAVLSDAGGYYELHELPEEFVGAVGGGVAHRLIAEDEAHELLGLLRALMADVARGSFPARALSLYVLYAGGSLRARRGMFVFDHQGEGDPFTHGDWQPGLLPRAFKLRLHLSPGQSPPPGLPHSGIVVFLAPTHTDGGQCLLATITRSPQMRDLTVPAASAPGPWAN